VLNAALGFAQEYRAERALAALKRMSAPTVKVRRGATCGRSRPENWRRGMWCCSRRGTSCRPTGDSWREQTYGFRSRRSPESRSR
jgi:hypothetical protein